MADLAIDQLQRRAESQPQAPLLPDRPGADWRGLTNARAWALSGAVASWLIAQGFGPGARRLAVPEGRSPERAILLLGALRAGALVVEGPLEIEYAALANCSVDAAVAERRLHIDAATPALQRGTVGLTHGDLTSVAQALED